MRIWCIVNVLSQFDHFHIVTLRLHSSNWNHQRHAWTHMIEPAAVVVVVVDGDIDIVYHSKLDNVGLVDSVSYDWLWEIGRMLN